MKKFSLKTIGIILSLFLLAACGTMETKSPPTSTRDGSSEGKEPLYQLETKLDAVQHENKINFIIKILNQGDQDAELTFTSGQRFEIVVTNKEGSEVYRYSINRSFIQAIETLPLPSGDKLVWEEEWDLKLNDQSFVPTGEYEVSVEILAQSEIQSEQLKASKTVQIEKAEEGKPTIPLENSAFRSIQVTGTDGEYVITGEARVFEAVMGYSVSDSHTYLVDESKHVGEGAPAWAPFTIQITVPSDKLPVNGTLSLELYEPSPKDGSRDKQLFVPLQSFGQ
jgi:hypothetical protein